MENSYLTRVNLNPRRRDARKLLESPSAMHAAVEAAFPPSSSQGDRRILWRLDLQMPRAALYVVSPRKPDFTHLVEQAGWPSTDEKWLTKDYQPFLDRLEAGQLWEFRLQANPTHMGISQTGEKKRFGHMTVVQQISWLAERADRLGVTFLSDEDGDLLTTVVQRDRVRFVRKYKESPVTLTRVTYQGPLRVDDPPALRKALVEGIGRGKAYGNGLMTLIRPDASLAAN